MQECRNVEVQECRIVMMIIMMKIMMRIIDNIDIMDIVDAIDIIDIFDIIDVMDITTFQILWTLWTLWTYGHYGHHGHYGHYRQYDHNCLVGHGWCRFGPCFFSFYPWEGDNHLSMQYTGGHCSTQLFLIIILCCWLSRCFCNENFHKKLSFINAYFITKHSTNHD